MTSSLDANLLDMLEHSRMIIICGPGGVGKTTSAAALGVVAARHFAKRVLVLTVDPARRLATALGLDALGNAEVPVDLPDAKGRLSVAMIDTKASWDDMVRRHAPDPTTCDRVLSNDLYKTLTSRFVHSHDYVVTERLYEARESGMYDLVVVDTVWLNPLSLVNLFMVWVIKCQKFIVILLILMKERLARFFKSW